MGGAAALYIEDPRDTGLPPHGVAGVRSEDGMKIEKKKLVLNRETLKTLEGCALQQVNGGAIGIIVSCFCEPY
jgi:hypothetical protein